MDKGGQVNPSWNERMGRAMRFCQECEGPMGISTRKEYAERFIHHRGLCPVCGKPAIKEDEEEVWLSLAEAHAAYPVSLEELGMLIHAGRIRWRPGHHYNGGRQVPEKEVQRCVRKPGRDNGKGRRK